MTNKFLAYMSRLECDVPGIEIKQTPDENQIGLAVDISKMQPRNFINFFKFTSELPVCV